MSKNRDSDSVIDIYHAGQKIINFAAIPPFTCVKAGEVTKSEKLSKSLIFNCAFYCHSFAKITRGGEVTNHRISKKSWFFTALKKISRVTSLIHGLKKREQSKNSDCYKTYCKSNFKKWLIKQRKCDIRPNLS